MFLEILGDLGYSGWDGRYEILLGDLLKPPTITEEVLFAPINLLRAALHEPAPPSNQASTTDTANDLEIPPLSPSTALPIDEKTVAVREGKLSPLAIKRPSPVLHKSEHVDSLGEVSALHVIEHDEKDGRLCAVDEAGAHLPFTRVSASKEVLETWGIKWQGSALGNFAKALLNALEIKEQAKDSGIVRRIRTAMQAFVGQKEILIQQMNGEDLNWTLWHQLEYFFQHYQRDADTPMIWNEGKLQCWVPSMLEAEKVYPDDLKNSEPKPWLTGSRVFQIRTDIYSEHQILNYENSWDDLSLSEIGKRFFHGIHAEIEREPNVQHLLICNQRAAGQVANLTSKENVRCLSHIKRVVNTETLRSEFELADVIWIVGVPYWPPHLIWKQAQILFGDDAEPLCYDVEFNPYHYKDERIHGLSEQNVVGILTRIIGHARLNRLPNKTVVILTGLRLPGITDRPETHLFDWEDFEIAGRLDKLEETITTRQRFEEEQANLTAESSREKVEEVLGVSKSQANRILTKLRGGKRPTMREQIHTLLSDGEKKTAALVEAIEGHPNAIKNELKRLVDTGEIVKVRRAVYTLPSA